MVQVIQRNRTPAEISAEALGQGIAGGLSGAIEGFQKQQQQTLTATALGSFAGFDENKTKLLGMLPVELQQYVVDRHVARGKERKGISKEVDRLAKRYGKGAISGDQLDEIENSALGFYDQGLSDDESVKTAFQRHFNPQEEEMPAALPQNQMQSAPTGTAEAKRIAPLTQKTLSPTPEVYGQQDQGDSFWNRVFKGTGQGAAMQAEMAYQPEALTQTGAGFTQGRTLGAVNIAQPETGGGEVFREASKLLGIGKTFGQIKGKIEKINPVKGPLGTLLSAGATGATMSSAEQLIQNGEIDPKKLAFETAVWTGLEGLFLAAPKFINIFKSPVEKIAKETGQTAEQILKTAAEESGADLAKAQQGDAGEINKLKRQISKEVPEVGKKVEAAPKEFAQTEKEIARREKTGQLLEARPLHEYYKEKKPTEHRDATVVKHQEVKDRVTPLLNQKNQELLNAQRDLMHSKEALKSASSEAKPRLEANIKHAEEVNIPRLKQQVDELKYELKNFEKPKTAAEIQADVTKSGDKYRQEAHNPTEKGQKEISAQLEKDKKFIEQAAETSKKGKLEGEIKPDTFLKMKQSYLEGYNAIIADVKEEIRALKGLRDAESLKQVANRKQHIKYLEQRATRLKADIQNQTDKLKVRGHLDKPSGAFYKQQLKTTRSDVEAFKKDYFEHIKNKTEGHAKAERLAAEKLKETPSELKRLTPEERAEFNKGREEGKKAFEENKAPETETKQEGKEKSETTKETKEESEGRSETIDAVKQVKSAGETPPSDKQVSSISNGIIKFYQGLLKRLPRMIANGVVLGTIEGVIEETTGKKIPSSTLSLLLPGVKSRIGSATISYFVRDQITGFFDDRAVNRIKSAKGKERLNAINDLRQKYPEKRLNKILSKVQKSEAESKRTRTSS